MKRVKRMGTNESGHSADSIRLTNPEPMPESEWIRRYQREQGLRSKLERIEHDIKDTLYGTELIVENEPDQAKRLAAFDDALARFQKLDVELDGIQFAAERLAARVMKVKRMGTTESGNSADRIRLTSRRRRRGIGHHGSKHMARS